MNELYRTGFGTDIHRLEAGKEFILGGVKIPFEKGFVAHSDGDVLIHAIIDAILGALALGDIGKFFPDTDNTYKDANSADLLGKIIGVMHSCGYEINNLDTNIHAQKPKLANYIDEIRHNLSKITGADITKISVKAKTGEGLDDVGHGLCVKTDCIVLLKKTS